MSVNPEDIKLPAGATLIKKPEQKNQSNLDDSKIQLPPGATLIKKKDNSESSTSSSPSSEGSAAGAAPVPGTTSTTPITKWEDNPLNPVKAANDYDAKLDKTPEILFKDGDNEKLTGLLNKHGVTPTPTVTQPLSAILPITSTPAIGGKPTEQPIIKTPVQASYESASRLVNDLEAQIKESKLARLEKREPKSDAEKELENDLQEAQNLKRKAATELVVNGDKEIEVNTRTNEIGNSFNQFMSDLISLNQPIKGKNFSVKETEDKLKKQPSQFLTGVNMLKLTDPAQYERITEAIAKGLPISASQTANITALGLNIEEAKLQRDIIKSPVTPQERQRFDEIGKTLNNIKPDIDKYEEMLKAKLPLTPDQIADYKTKVEQYNTAINQSKPLIDKVNAVDGMFAKKAQQLLETKRRNLIDNPEVLRGFIADGVATKLDEIGKHKKTDLVNDFMFGHTWNYSPEQIKWASEQYLKENGIDPSIPQAQDAIKFLQENEGVMIGENSIAKAGGFRELGEGLIEPIVGTAKTFKDWARPSNTTYAESQSAGNVDIAKKRLESEDTGIRSVVNDVLKGTGQFATQAAMMYAVSGGIGALSEGLMGKSGVQLLADAKAANIKPVFAFDDATANLAAGKFLDGIKNPLSVFTTSYAMAYDGNLKAALSYTSDNEKAKNAARFNSTMESATELFLSPLDIAHGIYTKFSKSGTKDLLKILSDKSLKNDPAVWKQYVGKYIRGVLGTAKVAGAEIGEEMVTQISDYVTNMYLNPESDSFKNRNLNQELMTTAYQTGLSMAVPALMNGIGAARANTFSKGSLLVSAQNRQAMVDNLNKSVANGSIDQKYADQQIQLINTAAVANAQVPKKANGADLNTNEKANYVWSRTTEAYMEKQMASTTDAAQKEIWKDKILKQQEYRKGILGLTEEQPEVPEYTIDDKPVSREELLAAMKEKSDGNYFVANDEEVQAALRKIGGVDDKVEEVIPEPEAQLPSDKELVKSVEEKAVPGYEKTSISELKEQALQAPASFKNQFDDEELTVNLIAKNTPEQIENAIKYQEERLTNDPNMDEVSMIGIDQHIQLLEKGLEKSKQQAKEEDATGYNSKIETVNVDDLEFTELEDGKIEALKEKDVEKYAEKFKNGETAPPILVGINAAGKRVVIDGHRRVLAAKKAGVKTLKAIVRDRVTENNKSINYPEIQLLEAERIAKEKTEGQPLSKLENLKAKKKLAEVEVPGETVDEKLKHISDKPEGFAPELVALAEKRFPKEQPKGTPEEITKPIELSTETPKEQSGKDVKVQDIEYKGVTGTTSVNVKEKDGIIKATFTGTRSDKPNAKITLAGYRYGGKAVKETLSDFEKDYGVKVDEIIDGVDIEEITVLEERAEVNPRQGVGTGQSVTLKIKDTEGNILNDINIVVNKRKFTAEQSGKDAKGVNPNGGKWEEVIKNDDDGQGGNIKITRFKTTRINKNGEEVEGQDGTRAGMGGREISWDDFKKEFKLDEEDINDLFGGKEPKTVTIHETRENEASGKNGLDATFHFDKDEGSQLNDNKRFNLSYEKPKQQSGKDASFEEQKADIEKRRQEELNKASVDSRIKPGTGNQVKVGEKFNDGYRVNVINASTHESYNPDIHGEGYTVYSKIISDAEFTDGKVSKVAQVETEIFPNKETADRVLKERYEKYSEKEKQGTKKSDAINEKYNAELAALEKEQSLSTKPEIKNEEAKADKVSVTKKETVIAEAKPDKEIQPAEEVEPKIKDVNLDKEIGLLSADFLEINKPEISQGSQRIKIVDIPLSSISTDTGTFQNRETEFSQESVDKILKAVQDDTFNWTEFDPITLWKDNGQLKVLSGHSRFEAFKQLTKRGYAGFDTIPAEIFEGSKEQAIAIALRSNTLSTKETPIERANFYREARLAGTASKSILNEAKEYEGRNAPTIIALSYLNPNGKAIAFLKALGQEGDTKSKANSLQMARWTGEVRQMFPQLTNEHENEIFDWLKDGAYNKIKNLPEITARINNVVSGFDFDPEQPLNLAHKGTKTYVDETYEQELADKEKQIKEQQKVIAEKSARLNAAELSPQEVAEKLVPDNAILSRMQQDYIKLKDKKGAISEANKGILSLFDNIQTEIDNGNITSKQAEYFINDTGKIEEDDTVIEDIERNAESPDTAATAIEEGNELIAGQDVNANRVVKAENKLAEKVGELEKEKTARINEITKPEIDMNTMLINDLFTLAGTTEANRQEYDEIKNQFYGLKNIIDCLFS